MKSPNKDQIIVARLSDAVRWGIVPAHILSHIKFWTEKNEKRKINWSAKHKRCFTCSSNRRLQSLFPYASYSSIRRALRVLHKDGIIIKETWPNLSLNGGKCLALALSDKYLKVGKTKKSTPPSAQAEHVEVLRMNRTPCSN